MPRPDPRVRIRHALVSGALASGIRSGRSRHPPQQCAGFARWVAEECPQDARVLNIGAGCNLSGCAEARSAGAQACSWGSTRTRPSATTRPWTSGHCQSLEDYAATGPEPFDLAFSVFVLEHVHDPKAFTERLRPRPGPGGVLMGMTVNMWHYFGLATWAATRAGVADRLLPHLRPQTRSTTTISPPSTASTPSGR